MPRESLQQLAYGFTTIRFALTDSQHVPRNMVENEPWEHRMVSRFLKGVMKALDL